MMFHFAFHEWIGGLWCYIGYFFYLFSVCIGYKEHVADNQFTVSPISPITPGISSAGLLHRGAARQMYGSGSLRPPGSYPVYGQPIQYVGGRNNATYPIKNGHIDGDILLPKQYYPPSTGFIVPHKVNVGRKFNPYGVNPAYHMIKPDYTIVPLPIQFSGPTSNVGIDGFPLYQVPYSNMRNETVSSSRSGVGSRLPKGNGRGGIYGGRTEYYNGRPEHPYVFGGKYPFDIGILPTRPYRPVRRPHQTYMSGIRHVKNDDEDDQTGAGFEHACGMNCAGTEFMCVRSCTCIDKQLRCDGQIDCEGEEDELECTDYELDNRQSNCDQNHTNYIRCPRSLDCISKSWLCDGDDDCGDYSDETNCGAPANCSHDQFECLNGLCIPMTWKCDNDNDCKDFSDETNCTKYGCTSDEFKCGDGSCISIGWKCDRQQDCKDGTDEHETNCDEDPPICGKGEFQCAYKKCIKIDFKCDGDNDCGDWSDEDDCPRSFGNCASGEFRCSNGKCIPELWRCDNQNDCEDNEDEKNCINNSTRTCSPEEYVCNNGACILKTWVCDGVNDCSHGEDENKCEITCDDSKFACKGSGLNENVTLDCINKKHVCDGQKDCSSGNDEINCPTLRDCGKDTNCSHLCITTHDNRSACSCSPGYKLSSDGLTCLDINECLYETDPVCSQTCNNTIGSFQCGCMTGYVLRPDLRSCKGLGASPSLLFANRMDIRQVSLSNSKYTAILKNLHNAIALDYHYNKSTIFWSDVSMDVVRKAYVNGTGVTDVIKWGLESPGGIAIDWIHDLLFWTDSGTRRVGVSTLDGTQMSIIVVHDLDKPRAIVVHPGHAFIFWTDWGPNPKIERADMDGSNRRNIITESVFWPNGLTLDYTASRIYWADAKHNVIETAHFDGSDRKKVITKGLPHPFALTIFEDAIYWTDWHTKSISSANKVTGVGFRTIHNNLHFPMDIHSYHPQRQPLYPNRCGTNNGGCEHLCLPNSLSFTCKCRMGMKLKLDAKSCQNPEKLLIFSRKKDIRIKHLDNNAIKSHDIVIPIEGVKSAVGLAWDSQSEYIFWTDIEKNTINKVHWNGSNQQIILHNNIAKPAGLAFDWLTNKIYWTDTGTAKIEVATANGSIRSLLIWEGLDKPRDIVVDPIGGYMYWSDWGVKPKIGRAALDGTMRSEVITNNLTWPNGLAIDYGSGRLCWGDGGTKVIECSNFDGTYRKVLIDNLLHPFGLDIYGNGLYWTDWDSHNIEKVNKNTGLNRTILDEDITDVMYVRVYHRNRKFIKTPCSNLNGGCSHLCLLKPNNEYSCGCPIGVNLLDDKTTCANGPKNSLIVAHRVDIRQISLDVTYFVDVVLPLPLLKNAVSVDVDRKTGEIYWTDTSSDLIQKSTYDGKNITTIIANELERADGIAIDSTGRKIYWTDDGRNTIEVSELDGSNRKVLIWQNIDSPRAIALHYHHALMFWSDWGTNPCIEVAEMDGGNRKKIITTKLKWPNGLAIDRPANRLYWNDGSLKKIESSNLDGKDRKVIITDVLHPYGLVVVGSHIYWTDWQTQGLHRADKLNGTDKKLIIDKLDGLMDVRSVQSDNIAENACGMDNGGCSHLCLRNVHSYSCACPTGISFVKDNDKICKSNPNDYIFLAGQTTMIRISLDTTEMWDTTLPLNNISHAMDVDFHYEKQLLAYTDIDNNRIRIINMNNLSDYHDIVTKCKSTLAGIAIDWIADHIYWTDNLAKTIEISKIDGTCRKVLLRNLTEPRSIAVFPRFGLLYFSQWGEYPKIERSFLDGTSRRTIVDTDLGFPNGLVIDFKGKRIYWSDAKLNQLETSDLQGRNRILLVHSAMGNGDYTQPFGLALHGDYIYWTDWYQKQVLRAERVNGKNPTILRNNLEGAMGITIVSKERQLGWNPCAEDNGGCSHLCLYSSTNYTCMCPDEPDHIHCKSEIIFSASIKKPLQIGEKYDYDDEEYEFMYNDIIEKFDYINPKHTTNTGMSGTFYAMALIPMLCIIILSIVLIFGAFVYRNRKNKLMYDSGRSVMTFANPNYFPPNQENTPANLVGDKKPFLWKRLKYEKSHDRVYEEKRSSLESPEVTSLIPTVLTPSSSNCEAVTPEFERSPIVTPLHRTDSIPLKTIT